MVSKNNQNLREQKLAQRVPHYGLRKLATGGVASVLLGIGLYFGGVQPVHADVMTNPAPTDQPRQSTSTTNQLTTTKEQPQSAALTSQPVTAPVAKTTGNTQSEDQVPAKSQPQVQPTTAVAVKAPRDAGATPSTSLETPDVQATLNQAEYNPKDGQAEQLTVKFIAQQGDKYQITIPQGAYDVSPLNLSGAVGTTSQVTNADGSVTITDHFNISGTFNQNITLTPFTMGTVYGLSTLYSAGKTIIPIIIKKNGQELGTVTFDQVITPEMAPTFHRTSPDQDGVKELNTGTDYQWTLKINEDAGLTGGTNVSTGVTDAIDHGTTVTIPVPDGFVLNKDQSEELSQTWTAAQAGPGQDIIFKSTDGNYKSIHPIILVGHFTQSLTGDVQTVTANGPITVVQDTGNGHSLTATLPPFSEQLMQDNQQPTGEVYLGGVQVAYDGTTYPKNDVPLSTDPNVIKMWSYQIGNNSAYDIKDVKVTITVPDGTTTTKIEMPGNINAGIINYTFDMYVDATHPDVVVTGIIDLSKNHDLDLTKIAGSLRKLTLVFDQLSAGEDAGIIDSTQYSGGLRIKGYVSEKYDDGKAVPVGAVLRSQETISAPLTGVHNQPWLADQYVVAAIKQPAILDASETQNKMAPGATTAGYIQTTYGINTYNNKDFVNPIFYYVLPNNAEFDQLKQPGSDKVQPQESEFKTQDGRTVLKVDYSGYNKLGWLPDSLLDQIWLNNKPDVGSATSDYQVYVVVPDGMKVQDGQGADHPLVTQSDLPYVQGHQNAYLIGSGNWVTQVNAGTTIAEQSQGNKNMNLVLAGESDNRGSNQMTYTGAVVNGNPDALNNVNYVLNLPDTSDGQSGFNFQLSGPVQVVDALTGQTIADVTVTYSNSRVGLTQNALPTGGDFTAYDAGQVSAVRSVKVQLPTIASGQAVRIVLNGIDPTLLNDVGKIGYLSSVVYTEDNSLKPYTVLPTDKGASSIKVTGVAQENATLTFHDDTDKVDIKVPNGNDQVASLTAQGAGGTQIQFTDAANLVQTLEGLGYVFKDVSGAGSNGATDFSQVSYGNYDTDPAVNQSFILHFVHGTKSEPTQTTVNLTVYYKYGNADGPNAHNPQSPAAITFNGTITTDQVTKKSTTKWDNTSLTFDPVTSPTIPGYTASQLKIADVTVTPTDKDQTRTVIYTADTQKAQLTFVDDDSNGKVLSQYTVNASGDTGSGITFANGQQNLTDLLNQNYLFNGADDTTSGIPIQLATADGSYSTINFGNYDNNDSQDQSFVIHLTHRTAPVSESQSANLTVHYVYGDGPKKGETAHPDQTAPSITFTRTGIHDLVTNQTTYGYWTPDQTFADVPSPEVAGYTPDQKSITGVMATPTTGTAERTVTYYADTQKAQLTFWDDTENKQVDGYDLNASGKTATAISFTDGQADLNQLLNKYQFVGVKNTTGGGDAVVASDPNASDPYTTIDFGNYDNNDGQNQSFVIHLTHRTVSVSESQPANLTVHYVYGDGPKKGETAHPDLTAPSITFTRTGTKDLVTNQTTYGDWTPDQTFADVPSPEVAGYTPDQKSITGVTATPTTGKAERTVTYYADTQKAQLTFWDDTENKQVAGYDLNASGKTDTAISFSDGQADLNQLLNKYQFVGVKNTTGGGDVSVTSDPNAKDPYATIDFGNYDNNDGQDQSFVIHLTHRTEQVTDQRTVGLTVHYQYGDGPKKGETAHPDQTAPSITFTRTGIHDLVTDQTTYGDWNRESATFGRVDSPTVAGYTPDKETIDGITVTPDSPNQDFTVYYTAVPNPTTGDHGGNQPGGHPGTPGSGTPTAGNPQTGTTQAGTGSAVGSGTTNGGAQAGRQGHHRLPQTGNAQQGSALALLGLTGLSLLGLGGRKKKRD